MDNRPTTPTTTTPQETERDTGLLIQLGSVESALEVISESSEGDNDSIMNVEGVALRDNIVSANMRYYSKEFNEGLIENTNRFIAEGGIPTMFTSHGKAYGTGGFFSPTVEELPIGKITKLFRPDARKELVKFKAVIMPTMEGQDVQILLRHSNIGSTSIRADGRTVTSRMGKVNGQDVEVMENATLSGIDFTARPGVADAGIDTIFESAPQVTYTQTKTEFEEEDMLEEATLDQLKEKNPKLIEELKGEFANAHEEEVGALTNQLASLTQALEASTNPEESVKLNEDLTVAKARVGELDVELAIAEAAHVGVSKLVAEKIRAGKPTTKEEVQALAHDAIKDALDEALASSLNSTSESGDVDGAAHPPDRAQSSTARKIRVNEDQQTMIRLAGGRPA